MSPNSNTVQPASQLQVCGLRRLSVGVILPDYKARFTVSKVFISAVLQESTGCTGTAANALAGDLIGAIVKEMKREGGFTLPSFGTFRVVKTKARKAFNPRTGEPVKVKGGKTVRFKGSPTLKKAV
jgi:DNA-binding protein HU-beta